MIYRLIASGLAGCALLLASPVAASVNARTSSFGPAATPVLAVKALVRPLYVNGAGTNTCDTVRGQLAGCPLTDRLRKRLTNLKVPANMFCRCQNTPTSVKDKQQENNGRTAAVRVTWVFGPTKPYSTVFIAIHSRSGWLVDDMYCAGKPKTSIYKNVGPCT
jgi:hypothetical protein